MGAVNTLLRAVVLVSTGPRLADVALQTSPDLSSNSNTVAFLDSSDALSNLNSLADNLVSYTEWLVELSPATSDGMNI